MDSSSSSKRERQWRFSDWMYDVFINFRGKDTRQNFVSHLYAALSNAGVNAFMDNEKLGKGEEIATSLIGAIEGSRISLVILSRNYVSSRWCLNELVQIMECHRTFRQVVIPIFYHVEPSHVRYQTGPFALEDTKRRGYTKEWKTALKEVGNLSGYHFTTDRRSEAEQINAIVKDLSKKLDVRLMPVTDFPVGLVSRIEEVIMFIERQSSKVCMVGIWGMGGLGKTTAAKAIFNRIHRKFEHKSFMENIREVCESHSSRGHIHLQEQLLSDILKTKEKIHSISMGTTMIEKRLKWIRALIVLDDVTTSEQLKALCGNRRWFGPGSVIIVTTRDARLLKSPKADHVCRMKEMDKDEALELFSWHAFGKASPEEDLTELSRNVVAYCGGLPIALEVLGSYLDDRIKEEWISVLSKLKKIPNHQVQEKLRISYDGLKDDMEKGIFLDICCFFIGKDRTYVTEILNGCELHADIGITILIERSLLTVDKNNKLGIHDLVRDMGREIVRESSKNQPGKRSRLWSPKDVHDVLTNNTGTKTVEGLVFKSQTSSRVRFKADAFKKMKKLRLLQLDNVELEGDYGYLSKELTWVYWRECAVKYIPRDFYQGSLVVLELKHTRIVQVWEEAKLMEKLKILNLSHSMCLEITPDFSKLPNLEKFIMKDCPNLREVHESIGDLSKILLINLENCTSLSNLPRKFYKLKSLETLIISGCLKIDRLEEDIEQMESLTRLIAKGTAVKEVPFSIVKLKSIGYISLCGYEGLSHVVIPSIIWSWMSPTINSLSGISPFGNMSLSLVSRNVQNDNSGYLSPLLSRLSKLRSLWIQCQSETQLTQELKRSVDHLHDVNFAEPVTTSHASQVSVFSLRSLLIGMGSSPLVNETLGKRIAQGLASNDSCNFFLPGDNYPSWLAYIGAGPSVKFEVPDDRGCCMKGITLCVLYSSAPELMATESLISVLIINYTKLAIQIFKRDTVMSFNDEDWQGLISNLGLGDNVQILVVFGREFSVKEIAVYLIYGESINMEDEPSIKVKSEPLPQVNVLSLPNVEMDPSPEINVHPSANMEMDLSLEVNMQLVPEVEMEPLAEVNVHPSANVEMEPSFEINLQPSTNVEMKPSPEIYVNPSDNPTSDTLAPTSAPSASVDSSSIQLILDRLDSMQIHFARRLDSFQASVNDRFTEMNSRINSIHDMVKKQNSFGGNGAFT